MLRSSGPENMIPRIKLGGKELEDSILIKVLKKYKQNPCLWDTSHKYYHNKPVKNTAWDSLLQLWRKCHPRATLHDVKIKVFHMRTNYTRQRRKVEASATSAALYKPTLWYYKHLNFLSGNKDPGSDDSDDSDSDSDHDADPVYVKLPRGVKRPASTSIDQEEETETSNNESAAAFGKSVGAQLHHLSKMQRCIAEKLISDVIYHAKMDHLTLDTSINVKESVDDPAIDLLPKAGPSWYDRGLETDTVRQESSSSCNLANIDEDLVKKEMEETENAVNFIKLETNSTENYVFDEDEHDDQDEQENSIHIMKEELL